MAVNELTSLSLRPSKSTSSISVSRVSLESPSSAPSPRSAFFSSGELRSRGVPSSRPSRRMLRRCTSPSPLRFMFVALQHAPSQGIGLNARSLAVHVVKTRRWPLAWRGCLLSARHSAPRAQIAVENEFAEAINMAIGLLSCCPQSPQSTNKMCERQQMRVASAQYCALQIVNPIYKTIKFS